MKNVYFLLAYCMFCFLSIDTVAQNPQYNYTPNSITNNAIPMSSTSNIRQNLYYPSDFNAPSGMITKLYIGAASAANNPTYSPLTVKMGSTTMTVFAAGPFVSGLTTVFSQTSNFQANSAAWLEIVLPTPYFYDNSQNLIIEISQGGYSGGFSAPCASNTAVPSTTNRTLYGTVSSGTGSLQARLMKMGFDIAPAGCSGTPTGGTASVPAFVCPNANFNLSLTGQSTGTGITIQWQSSPAGAGTWTNITGATTATYTVTGGISAATDYRARVTCTSNSNFANSNTVAVGLLPVTTPTISISGNSSVCAGTSVTYTATTNITGGTIQWIVNGNNVGTNSTTYTYAPANGDVVTATITAPTSGCYNPTSANSNAITMSVAPSISLTASITGSATLCVGDNATYTATTSISGASYQWKVDGNNVGTNSPTYIHTGSSSFAIQCVVTPPAGCYSPAIGNSNTINVTVSPYVTPSITINESSNGVCAGTPIVFTASANVTAGTYQWKVNNINVGTNSATYSYSPLNNDQVICQLTNPLTGCFTTNNVVSNTISMSVIPITVPSVTISVDSNNICFGMVSTFAANTNIIGATYQWKVNNQNIGFDTSVLTYLATNGDIVLCQATIPPGGCYTASGDTSNAITMAVGNNLPTNISISGNAEFCTGNPSTYTAVSNVPGSNYQWQVNGVNVGINSQSFTYNPTDQDTLTCIVKVVTGCFMSPTATSNAMVLTGKAAPSPKMIPGTDMFYSNYPTGNEWFRNDTLIYTGLVINIPKSITFPSCYYLKNTNYLGCWARTADSCLYPITTGISNVLAESEVQIYPNPSSDVFIINSPAENGDYFFELMDMTGRKLQTGTWKVRGNKIEEKVSVVNYADGIYFLAIRNEKSGMIKRLEKR